MGKYPQDFEGQKVNYTKQEWFGKTVVFMLKAMAEMTLEEINRQKGTEFKSVLYDDMRKSQSGTFSIRIKVENCAEYAQGKVPLRKVIPWIKNNSVWVNDSWISFSFNVSTAVNWLDKD